MNSVYCSLYNCSLDVYMAVLCSHLICINFGGSMLYACVHLSIIEAFIAENMYIVEKQTNKTF